jgi:hypothetical protein
VSTLISLLLFLTFSNSSHALPPIIAGPTCARAFVPISLDLEPDEIYRIGTLARTANGVFLVSGHYEALGHESLIEQLVKKEGPIEHLYWEGEIISRRNGLPLIRVANDTSRHFLEYQGSKSLRPLDAFHSLLLHTKILTTDFAALRFSENNRHLDADLNKLDFNLRHDLAQPLMVIMFETESLIERKETINALAVIQKEAADYLKGVQYFIEKGYLEKRELQAVPVLQAILKAKTSGELSALPEKDLAALADFTHVLAARMKQVFFPNRQDFRIVRVQ